MSLLAAALAGAGFAAAPRPIRAGSAGGAAPAAPSGPSGGAGPLAHHALTPEQRYAFDGEVVEVLGAGPYAYLRVRASGGDRWVTTLEATRPQAAHVTVRVIGESAHFHSSRLDRDFTDLAFGIVRAR